MSRYVVMLGPPGAGKGTQAERLASVLAVPRVSTGDMLREAVVAGNALGHEVRSIMASGGLVGDRTMIAVVRERLGRPDAQAGFVLDGFPRTPVQAAALDEMLGGRQVHVLDLVVPEAELVRRLDGRRVCAACGINAAGREARCLRCGGDLVQREDDGVQVVVERLRVYHRDSEPVVEHYRGRNGYRQVDGGRHPDTVAAELAAIVAGDVQ